MYVSHVSAYTRTGFLRNTFFISSADTTSVVLMTERDMSSLQSRYVRHKTHFSIANKVCVLHTRAHENCQIHFALLQLHAATWTSTIWTSTLTTWTSSLRSRGTKCAWSRECIWCERKTLKLFSARKCKTRLLTPEISRMSVSLDQKHNFRLLLPLRRISLVKIRPKCGGQEGQPFRLVRSIEITSPGPPLLGMARKHWPIRKASNLLCRNC